MIESKFWIEDDQSLVVTTGKDGIVTVQYEWESAMGETEAALLELTPSQATVLAGQLLKAVEPAMLSRSANELEEKGKRNREPLESMAVKQP